MKRLTLTLLTPLVLTACVSSPPIYAPKTSCSELVADTWTEPVPDAPLPQEGETVLDTLKSWINFGVTQTAGKRTEYERGEAKVSLITRCEVRDQQAIERAQPRGLFGLRR